MKNDHAMDAISYAGAVIALKSLAFDSVVTKPVRWWQYFYLWIFMSQRVEATIGDLKYTAWYREVKDHIYILKDKIEGV